MDERIAGFFDYKTNIIDNNIVVLVGDVKMLKKGEEPVLSRTSCYF